MGIAALWRPITPATLAELPDAPAVFELASLVRSILFIGGRPGERLRSEVSAALGDPRLRSAARYVRFELTQDAPVRAEEILSEYRATHRGELPSAQRLMSPGARRTAIVQASEPRAKLISSERRDVRGRLATPIEPTFLHRRHVVRALPAARLPSPPHSLVRP